MADIEIVNISAIKPDPMNANKGTAAGQSMVDESFARLGAGRSVLLDSGGGLIAGHKSTNGAKAAGIQNVRIIETDGSELIAVKRMDIAPGSEAAQLLGLADNQTAAAGLEFDYEVLDGMAADGLDVEWLFDDLIFDDIGAGIEFPTDEAVPEETAAPAGVPDTIWPSDNDYGIPLLDITKQADAFDLPIKTWGSTRRGREAGTYHFYTDDYRFSALWDNPEQPIAAGVVNLVEPNFTITATDPPALTIWRTYQKRWLARYWQSRGARIFVDLNVSTGHDGINLLGVPKGWMAYASRGYSAQLQALDAEVSIAESHAGAVPLFLVFGGGKLVKAWCKDNATRGVVWYPENMDLAKGKYTDGDRSQWPKTR